LFSLERLIAIRSNGRCKMSKFLLVAGSLTALVVTAGGPALHAGEKPVDPDEQILLDAKIGTDTARLQAFLKKRAESDADLLRLEELIRELGSTSFKKREEASRRLLGLGMPAVDHLCQVTTNSDKELARRAEACLKHIAEQNMQWATPQAAVRLLVRRQAPGTVEALLAFLPYAVDEETEEEIWYGLDALAVRAGKANTTLVAALRDPFVPRRAAAACILGRQGDPEQRVAVRKLLDDQDPVVRLRAAQGLLAGRDKSAIPALVRLLDEPRIDISWQAEELLHWIAGDAAPDVVIGAGTAATRSKCRTAWEGWWRGQEAKLDLDKVNEQQRRPGLLLVWNREYKIAGRERKSRVWLCGCDGKPRWVLELIGGVSDVQLLRNGRLLLGQSDERGCVSERDLEAKVFWEKGFADGAPFTARRLPNGNTFILVSVKGTVEIHEIQHNGSDVYSQEVTESITSAQRLPSGHIHCTCLRNALAFELEPRTGTRVKELHLGGSVREYHVVEPLSGGHYLLTAALSMQRFSCTCV
jgi:hypothetical protein